MAYTTPQNVQAWMERPNLDETDIAVFNRIIDTVDSIIDTMTNRNFESKQQTRIFDTKKYKNKFYLGDTVSIAENGVEMLSGVNTYTTIAATEYSLGGARNGRPANTLYFHSMSIPPGDRVLKVTGNFGWSETPPSIIQLSTMLSAKYVLRNQSPQGNIRTEPTKGDISINAYEDKEVQALTREFMLKPIGRPEWYIDG